MSEHDDIEHFFRERFGKEPENDPSYFEEWKGRLSGLGSMEEVPAAMDDTSRRAWGRITGHKLGYVVLMGWDGPVYQLVNLQTGNDIGGQIEANPTKED